MSTKEQLAWLALFVFAAVGAVSVCSRSSLFQRQPHVLIESRCERCHGHCDCTDCKCGGSRR